jgi:transposase-like protein
LAKRSFLAGTAGSGLASLSPNPDSVSTALKITVPSNPTIGGESQSSQKPHCPHCGSDSLNLLNDGHYRCLDCKKRFVTSKIVWK